MAVIELFVRICLLACCHTCGVAVIELFVRICLLACVSSVTCMEWLAQLGRFNRLPRFTCMEFVCSILLCFYCLGPIMLKAF